MPRVRMLTSLADRNFGYFENQVVDVPPARAKEWIADGVAELVTHEAIQTPERRKRARMETRTRR